MTENEFILAVETQRAEAVERFIVPVYRRLSADLLTPVSAFLALRDEQPYAFLLESVEGGEKMGRYSFLGRDPFRVLRGNGDRVTIETLRAPAGAAPSGVVEDRDENVFAALGRLMSEYTRRPTPDLPRLSSGAVGYLSYDCIRLIEHLPDAPPDELGLPDALWCFYDTVAAFDHLRHQIVIVADAFIGPDTDVSGAYHEALRRTLDLEETFRGASFDKPQPISLPGDRLDSNISRDRFKDSVEVSKRHIFEGDIFQVVLSQRFSTSFSGDSFNLYRALRQVNPSPYLFYLDFGDFELIGSSPEVLVRVDDGRAEVLPIAGTRRRGETAEHDLALEQDLLADPKERAEHLMLVDLGRNDLGRVCDYRSVQVDRYAYVERYSHVMHIVSSVSGRLRSDRTALDVLAACFPAGTVSGAPKVRAMEIIDQLEPTRRGVYAGAVGYIDYSGNLDTCIAIRTMVARDGRVYIQAGAGIVADSDPDAEYEETVNKARALHQALLVAADDLL